jgi:flagellar protein FlbD
LCRSNLLKPIEEALIADETNHGDSREMIELTRLNGHRLIVNCDLIKVAEATPDTTLTLITGEKLIVRESCDELIERIMTYRGQVLGTAWPDAATALSVRVAHHAVAAISSSST